MSKNYKKYHRQLEQEYYNNSDDFIKFAITNMNILDSKYTEEGIKLCIFVRNDEKKVHRYDLENILIYVLSDEQPNDNEFAYDSLSYLDFCRMSMTHSHEV